MDNDKVEQLHQIIENGYDFQAEKYISKGFQICTQYALGFIAFCTFQLLITATLGRLGQVGDFANRIFIVPALSVGMYIVANCISQQRPYKFDQFWEGFKDIQQLAMMALFQYIAFLIIVSPILLSEEFGAINEWLIEWQLDPTGMDTLPDIPSWFWLLLLPIIYITVSWIFAPFFIVFYKMRAWDALEASRKLVAYKWFNVAFFLLIVGIIGMSGLLFFGIGLLFTLPMSSCMLYASFENITGFNEAEEKDDPMKDLMDAF